MQEGSAADSAATVALLRLQAAYGDAVTRRAWDEVRDLFEPDAVVHIDTRIRPPFDLDGPQALTDFIDRSLQAFRFFEFAILNSVVELSGDVATGRVYICELRHAHDGQWTQAFGLYRDTYRRRHGRWRIAGRRYASLARTGADVESFELPGDRP
jgi:hypothetical protein